jgi:methylmalonyl-CoA mutase C-terminal domain/subunit
VTQLRVVIGLVGLDQHEIGARVVAALLRDAGVEVIYAGKFNTPQALVNVSLQEGADVIGISAHSWEYLDHIPTLLALLRQAELATPVVVGGSVITPTDRQTLIGWGVADVFGPDTDSSTIVSRIRALGQRANARGAHAST